uniref:Uncharacterized protein n=1 Tax=Anguilla anguilla TaxID=7936 RepID=A0A0E9W602_ANGAN
MSYTQENCLSSGSLHFLCCGPKHCVRQIRKDMSKLLCT